MTNRRYTDEEVAAIFAKAIEAEAPTLEAPARSGGLTLTELHDIARDVGIAPDVVTRAANSLDAGAPAAARTFMGFPIAVERTVVLNRRLTDAEWELLVVKLREAFDARGKLSAYGSFRQWTNGNLQALLEPTQAGGHRLRLRTRRAASQASMRMGMVMMGSSVALGIVSAVNGQIAGVVMPVATLLTVGIAMFASGVRPLRSWAETRSRQMEAIAEELGQG